MTSGLFNCYESAADVRSTDEDTWLSRQKLSCRISGYAGHQDMQDIRICRISGLEELTGIAMNIYLHTYICVVVVW